MGRPKIEIDLSRVEDLAAQGLSQRQICVTLGISEDTLIRRKRSCADFAAAIERGCTRAAVVVANKLFELARNGNVSAIVWWEKTRLGYSDRLKSEVAVKQTYEDLVAAQPASPDTESAQANRVHHTNRVGNGE